MRFYPLTYLLGFQALRLVEVREFRDLCLLLRGELGEADIPRRTLLHKEVKNSWVEWFLGLRDELQVRLTNDSLQDRCMD